jgi:hypothetical protein
MRNGKTEATPLFKTKNFILHQGHINELINLFQFKKANNEQDEFRSLTTFSKLMLQKMLAPEVFVAESWRLASMWRDIVLGDHNNQVRGRQFYFCNASFWTRMLSPLHCSWTKTIQVIQESKEGTTGKIENKEQKTLILDSREWSDS